MATLTALELSHVPEVKLTYVNPVCASKRPKITSSTDAYDILLSQWDMDTLDMIESFKVIYLNRANKVLGVITTSIGSVSGTIADPMIIFAGAIKSLAPNIILAHNHPSGTLRPSKTDIMMTKKLIEGGKLLDISVLDHLILTRHGYYSFADKGDI